jgi:uncharacterized repeat protein (TIGR01451 family)/fimbrial isopeptide formation D2 family protein
MALAVACAIAGALAAVALALGSDPAITLTQSGGGVLFGNTQSITLTAANPSSQSDWGYNLSYEVTLPANTSYVATTTPGVPAPTVLMNVPSGETTVIWQNVADLSPGSSNSLTFTVSHNTTALGPGDTYMISSGAYVNTDVRQVPQFSTSTGAVDTTTETGSATASQTSTINAIELSTSEPSPEGKLLRGVHDHRTIYTLTVTNNSVNQTTGIAVTEYLPADLEYLGCGTGDNTTDAATDPGTVVEYQGAPALNAAGTPAGLAGCVPATSVTTVSTTPPGASSAGVYTVVTLPVGTLAAGASTQLQFVAGVPIRANTTTWTNGTPTGTAEASNLDNNSGPETYHDEDATVYGQATGAYNNVTPVSAESSLSRTVMDVRILKSDSSGNLVQGQDTQWTLTIQTGEYRYLVPVTVTDTVPNGLCPIDYPTQTTTDPECQGTSDADAPSLAWDNTPSEQVDGTWMLHWTLPATLGPDASYVITYNTRTRTHYRASGHNTTTISSDDSITNNVALASTSFRKCINGNNECTGGSPTKTPGDTNGTSDPDSDSASQTAAAPTIAKTIQTTSAYLANCASGTYGATPPSGLVPGDKVCYELRVVFPASVDTQVPSVTDFLPPNLTYVSGSIAYRGDNTVTPSTTTINGNTITWALGSDVAPGAVFDVVLAGDVAQNLSSYPAGYLTGNLMKTNFANTPGVNVPNRAERDFTLTAPSIDLVKGVDSYTPPGGSAVTESGPGVDNVTVPGDSLVKWRVDVENQGGDGATGEIWDRLPGGLRCASVVGGSISAGGACVTDDTNGDYIDWTNVSLAADTTIAGSSQTTLTYTTDIGSSFSPGQLISSSAGVRVFTTTDNQGGTDTFYPQNDIDPSITSGQENASEADDPSGVQLTGLGFTHTITTGVNETGNDLTDQATIGEDVTYTDTLTVPANTTLYDDPSITTALPSTLATTTAVSSSYAVNGTPTAMPAGWTTSSDGSSSVSLAYGSGTWANSSGVPETFTLSYTTNVLQSSSNVKGDVITDTATLAYTDQSNTAQSDPLPAAVTVVEPSITASLTSNAAGNAVSPGATYTYTAKLSDSASADVSAAHDNTMIVTVPAGLTPWSAASGGSAVVDGGLDHGWTWSQSARTLTYNGPADVFAGNADSYTFYLNVNSPAISGSSFLTSLTDTTTSYPGAPPNGTERSSTTTPNTGYISTKNLTVTLASPALTKQVSPTSATFGSTVVYTLTVDLAANVTYYDTTLLDTIPSGISYDGNATITGCSGCSGPGDTPTLTTNSAGSTVAFYLGVPSASPSTSIPESTSARTLTLTFDGHVNSSAADGTTQTDNSVNVYDDTTSRFPSAWPSSPPSPGSYDQSGTAMTAAVTVVEPAPTISKSVSGNVSSGEIAPGDSPTYTLTISNTSSTWPLYDVVVSDTPSSVYTNVQLASGVSTTDDTTNWTAPGSTITWVIPTIAAGGSVTLSYTATLPGSSSLHSGEAIDNSASVTSSQAFNSSFTGMYPGYTYKTYTAGPSSLDLSVEFPVVSLTDDTGAGGYPNSANAQIGQPFVWHLVYSNSSPPTAYAVAISDTIPADYTYTPGSATLDGSPIADPAISGRTLTFSASETGGALADGGSHVLEFTTVPSTAAAGDTQPQANEASATWEDATGAGSSSSGSYQTPNEAAYANLIVPVLTVTKVAASPTVDAGASSSYTITVANTGAAPARDVAVADTLPSGEGYIAASATAVPSTGFSETASTAPNVAWQISELDPGDHVVITLPVTLAGTLDAGAVLTNTVSVTSKELPTAVTAHANITTAREVNVSLAKTGPATIDAGQSVTWTLDAHNAGPSDARAVQITDPLPSGTTFLSADSGCSNAVGTVTCDAGTLDAGSDAIFHVTATIGSGVTGTVNNTASVSTSDPNSSSSTSASQTVNIGNAVDLAITDTAAEPVIAQTLDGTFTLGITNAGPSDAYSATVVDTLPAGLTYVSSSPSEGTCSDSGQVVTCMLGDVPVGSTPSIAVVVQGTTTGQFTNTATVSTSPQTDTNLSNNTATAPISVVVAANLALTKTGPATIAPGMDATYLIATVNHGPAAATNVTVTDQLPAGVTFVSGSSGCGAVGTTVTCAVGTLADGASAQVSVTVSVPASLAHESIKDTASAAADQQNLDPANSSASFATTVGVPGHLSISKHVNHPRAHGGEVVSYTIVVVAHTNAVSDITVCDRLAPQTVYVAAAGANYRSGSACWTVLSLSDGAKVTFHVRARLEPAASGTLVAPASASAPGVPSVRAQATVIATPTTGTAGGGVTG